MLRHFGGALLLSVSAAAWGLSPTPFVEAHTGTMGTGGEVGMDFGPVRIRTHFSRYDFSDTEMWDGVAYETDTRLGGSGILVDVAPWNGRFFVTAGLLLNDVEVEALSERGDFDIGGQTLHDGRIIGEAEFSERVPWLGFGWRFFHRADKQGLGGSFEVGAWFNGEADVEIRTDQPSFDAYNRAAIEQEEENVAEDMRDGEILPVVKLGLMYYF